MAQHEPALRLYAIIDAESCARRNLRLLQVAQALHDAGVQLVQYRDKTADRDTLLANARALREIFAQGEAVLILNDHPELVNECGFDGAHIGQNDVAPAKAREHVGPQRILGISTHSAEQALAGNGTDADYLAIGPVFATTTKPDADPVVGLCGVQAARAVTNKPLVAIGGITAALSNQVMQAGADCVSVISALLPSHRPDESRVAAEDFLARLK